MENNASMRRIDGIPLREWVAVLFGFALLMRLMIACVYLNSYDTEWNLMWGFELNEGFFSAYAHVTKLDYPPLYLYPLYAVGRLLSLSGEAGYIPLRMLAIKFMPCLADSLTCVILFRLGRRWGSVRNGLMTAALWAVNPATVFNCACWGQTDCVLICLAALLLLALEEKRVTAAGVLFGAMCATKLQGLYLAPVVGMEVLTICFGSLHYRTFRLQQIRRAQVMRFLRFLAGTAGTLAVIYLPFMIGSALASADRFKGFFLPLTVYGGGVDKYPYITMNADNFYMLFDLNGVKDSLAILPGVTAAGLGSFFLLASVALVVAVYVFGKRSSQWLAAYVLMECIFMLTCRQHERYQILTLVLLAGALLQTADKRLLRLLTGQMLVIFVNQWRILGFVRDRSGWWHYYSQAGSESLREVLRQDKTRVIQDGAAWLHWNVLIGRWNALLNVALFFVSLTLALRFFFDKDYRRPFFRRACEWWEQWQILTEGGISIGHKQ